MLINKHKHKCVSCETCSYCRWLSFSALAEVVSIKEVNGVTYYYVHYVDCKFEFSLSVLEKDMPTFHSNLTANRYTIPRSWNGAFSDDLGRCSGLQITKGWTIGWRKAAWTPGKSNIQGRMAKATLGRASTRRARSWGQEQAGPPYLHQPLLQDRRHRWALLFRS